MASGLNAPIVKDFHACFESRCLTVIGDAYHSINKLRKIDINYVYVIGNFAQMIKLQAKAKKRPAVCNGGSLKKTARRVSDLKV
ncbi:MAG: hypothetical protein WC340_10485 [Kiritimatiellia bacterium]